MTPTCPIFIPTKGRADTRLTIKLFDRLRVPYTIFVEEPEYLAYAAHVDRDRIHVLPHVDRGLTVTRNYIWDYAAEFGHEWFWTFDDNIAGLYRFNHNVRTPCMDATILAVIEDFAQRYANVAIAGMNYTFFVKRRFIIPPFLTNTRIYSNMLIRTHATDADGQPFRNVTFFNDDTDLCLRALKAGWCTVLFNAFLIDKKQTMTVRGGNTELYERTDRRREFAEELQRAHPDCVRVVEKWGRWHHYVDYSRFDQRLRWRDGVSVPRGTNDFGMVLQERTTGGAWQTTLFPRL